MKQLNNLKHFLVMFLVAVSLPMLVSVSNKVIATTTQERLLAVAWKPFLRFDNVLYPSYMITAANIASKDDDDDKDDNTPHILGNPRDLIGIAIINPRANTPVRLEVKIAQLGAVGTFQDILKDPKDTYYILPKIQYRFDELIKIKQTIPVNVVFNLFIDGKPAGQKIEIMQLRSINECVRGYKDKKGKYRDTRWMYAAYVNEEHPLIDQILREALDTKIVSSFNGYQKSTEKVYEQVFAIWYLFQKKGFKYSSITTNVSSRTGQRIRTQNIRFIEESLKTSQANCVDGTVLFASVLRKIGIEPFLVLIPGHCFLGFYLDKDREEKAFLETTLMGRTDLEKYDEEKSGKRSKKLTKDEASYRAFNKALDVAEKKYEDNKAALDDTKDHDYVIIDIKKMRKKGILPIPSENK